MYQLVGIYGAERLWKTRFVEAIVKHISIGGFSSRGCLQPGDFEEGVKTGITAQLIPNGESRN
jgi:hypothetical protein